MSYIKKQKLSPSGRREMILQGKKKKGKKEGSEGRKKRRQASGEGRKSRERKGKERMERGKNEKKKNYQTF